MHLRSMRRWSCAAVMAILLTACGGGGGGGGGSNGIYSTYDIWMHDANGALLKSFKVVGYAHGLLRRQLVVSGDARMMVSLTDDPAMVIVAVGP